MIKLIPPPEGEAEGLQRGLDMCQGFVVTIDVDVLDEDGEYLDAVSHDVILWNFCETDDDGYLFINAADFNEDDVTDDRTNRRLIRTIDISTLEVC